MSFFLECDLIDSLKIAMSTYTQRYDSKDNESKADHI